MIGERELIERVKRLFPVEAGVVGVGDDCAVVARGERAELFSSDILVEGRHFVRGEMAPRDLGYKALAVNLSDIAAMGGEARFALLSGALPNNVEETWVFELLEGFAACAKRHGVQVLGGDTTGSDRDVMLGVTVVGEMELAKVRLRSMAQVGDVIAVTGPLGVAARSNFTLVPEPHLREGQWLAEQQGVHAMMDVSDGLASDLPRMAEASGCGFALEMSGLDLPYAASGGEDYCLLVTIDGREWEKVSCQAPFSLTRLGAITNDEHVWLLDSELVDPPKPFEHFN